MHLNNYTNKLQKIGLLMFLWAIFLFAAPARASQSIDLFPVSQATYKWTDNTRFTPQEVDFSSSGCIDTVTLLFANPQSSSNLVIASTTKDPNSFGIFWTGVVTSSGPTATTTYYTFFASSTAVDATHNRPWCHGANERKWFITPNNANNMMSESSSTYTNASYWADLGYSVNSYTFGSPAQPHDLWVNFNGFSNTGSSIIITPTPTSTCGFGSWQVQYNLSTSLYSTFTTTTLIGGGTIIIGVNIGSSGDTLGGYSFMRGITGLTPGIHNQWVPQPYLMPTGSIYYARAYICNSMSSADCTPSYDNPHLVVQSPEWQFIILPEDYCTSTWAWQGQQTYDRIVTNTYQSILNDVITTCNGIDNTITSALCKGLAYIFVPSSDVLNNFTNLRTAVSNKPPFAYFTVYSQQVSNLTAGTSTTALSTTTVFSFASSTAALANLSIIQILKNVFGWFLWVVFVFYLFKRFKYFSLHG